MVLVVICVVFVGFLSIFDGGEKMEERIDELSVYRYVVGVIDEVMK